MAAPIRQRTNHDAVADSAVKLIRYDAACRALALAKSTDEAKRIHNGSAALRAYAKQAKNRQLEMDAAEIRIRAERRIGELMALQKQAVGTARGKRSDLRSKKVQVEKLTLAEAGIDQNLADRARKLAAVSEPQFERRLVDWRHEIDNNGGRVTTQLIAPTKQTKQAVHFSSETAEHFTPPSILAAVRDVFGDVPDLDPCSNSPTRPNVDARTHFTEHDDGLSQPWSGRVFLNPPYGRVIGDWIRKVRHEWSRGEVSALIALLPARTDTEWFDDLTTGTDDLVICFLRGRLTFVGNTDPAPFPSLVAYFGPQQDQFAAVFRALGSLWQRPPLDWFVNHD